MDLSHYSPEPPMSRTRLVLAFYGGLGLLAVLISAGRQDVDIYRIAGTSTTSMLVVSPLIGLAIGLIVARAWQMSAYRFEWARLLHHEFRNLLGPLTQREIFVLAIASSVGEELLFRGALLPWIGLWPQAIIFALLHIGPNWRFLPWTASALLLGAGFGQLFAWSGDLGGPIAAHFAINYLNLQFISRVDLSTPIAKTPAS